MSDKNRVITNGLFRKKMAELLGEDIVNTPQFNDFQALDVSTFTREIDKLINNPPWSGGSGGESEFFIATFTLGESNPPVISCNKTIAQLKASTKPIMAFIYSQGVYMPLENLVGMDNITFMYSQVTHISPDDGIITITITGDDSGASDVWTMEQDFIPFDSDPTPNKNLDYTANIIFTGTGFTVDDFADDGDQAVSISSLKTALNIGNDVTNNRPSKYITVRTSISGQGTVNHGAILQFTDMDIIASRAVFSGYSVDTTSATPALLAFTLIVEDNDGTPAYTFNQHNITTSSVI